MRTAISLILLSPYLISCNTTNKKEESSLLKKPTDITINFRPAFDEISVINISEKSGGKLLSILLKNNIRIDNTEDTFYYYEHVLTSVQSKLIDSCIAAIFSMNIQHNEPHPVADGIFFNIIKSVGRDSAFIYSHSPDSIKNKEEFTIALNIIANLKSITSDTLVNNYFDDIKCYFTDQEHLRNTPLMKRRESVYHLKYYR